MITRKALKQARPTAPFTILMVNGDECLIASPECLDFPADEDAGICLAWSVDGALTFITLDDIDAIEYTEDSSPAPILTTKDVHLA